MKKPILIFGSTGLLGSQLSIFFKKNYNVVTVGHTKKNCNFNIDLNNKNKTLRLIKKIKPRVIINCVAYTDVDKCNSNLNTAFDEKVQEDDFSPEESAVDEEFNQEVEEELLDIPTFLRRQAN